MRKGVQRKRVNDMPYKSYVTLEYYLETYKGNTIPIDELEKALRQASRHIDSMTYNRIVGRGISALTEFQQETIMEVVCLQADFEYENADEINTILQGYSINGVSAQFGKSWNVYTDKGIAMKKDIYTVLSQTGLCSRLVR